MTHPLDHTRAVADARLEQANQMYTKAKNAGSLLSLLLLAVSARQVLPATVKAFRMGFSEQGDFMSLGDVELFDECHATIDADEFEAHHPGVIEAWIEQAESEYAWNLTPGDRAWTPYTAAGQGRVVVIDEVIKALAGGLE